MCETEANIVNGHRCVGPRSVHCLRGDALSLSDAKDGVERFTVDVLNKKNIMSKDSVRRPPLSSFAITIFLTLPLFWVVVQCASNVSRDGASRPLRTSRHCEGIINQASM